ncbi:MAG: hypothetical protein NC187_07635 [Candidatus Amulumruptor caecigallinarius]|nr:hypothetical protein [Candidatus Amulumruptor caecigallinarius]MCM1397340.1 hypothetical protein [Candidatus Amulumruptor caecigallinarius]MCM1453597.1 hypothetical protein [bacterium]
MLTFKQISLTLSFLLVSVFLTSCGGDDDRDEPTYVTPTVQPGGGTDTDGDDEVITTVTPEQMCGQWALTKVVFPDGTEKELDIMFALNSVDLYQSFETIGDIYQYSGSSDDPSGIITAMAFTHRIGMYSYIYDFSLAIVQSIEDVTLSLNALADINTFSAETFVMNGSYLESIPAAVSADDYLYIPDATMYVERVR